MNSISINYWSQTLMMVCPISSEKWEISILNLQQEELEFHPAFWIITGLFLAFGVFSALNEDLFNSLDEDQERDSLRVEDVPFCSDDDEMDEYQDLFNKDDPLIKETQNNTEKNMYIGIDHSINLKEEIETLSEKNNNIEKLSFHYFRCDKLKKPSTTKSCELNRSLTNKGIFEKITIPNLKCYNSQTEPSTVAELSPKNKLSRKRVRFQ
ncbi:unnamed protein product [Moneuplotes crassus]|uniref:Uncharacterized protein n=1 Tax=Euplotes crassus TaxID=5936 RepID=A0AAD1XIG8_EUPCR|nr:unnamed protein product [Moneuplotes crassus]